MDWREKLDDFTALNWAVICLLMLNLVVAPVLLSSSDSVKPLNLSYPTLKSLSSQLAIEVHDLIEASKSVEVRSSEHVAEVPRNTAFGSVATLAASRRTEEPIVVDSSALEVASTSLNDNDCYEIGPFTSEFQQLQIRRLLASVGFTVDVEIQNSVESLGYWVFFPPLPNLSLGRLKVEELRLEGFNDAVLLLSNIPLYAISLGFFADEKEAHIILIKAQSLGFDVKVDIRSSGTGASLFFASRHKAPDSLAMDKILLEYKDIDRQFKKCR